MSTTPLQLARDRCTSAPIGGKMGQLCCCSNDRCNANQPKSTGDKVLGLLNGVMAGRSGK